MMVPSTYQQCESLYPGAVATANEVVCAGQKRVVYNLNPSVQIQPALDNKFFVCEYNFTKFLFKFKFFF